jgi:putative membrane protein
MPHEPPGAGVVCLGMNKAPCRLLLGCAAMFAAVALSPSLLAQAFTLKLGPTPAPPSYRVTPFDCFFMKKAAMTDEKEIEISEAVLGQLSTAELRDFARRMIADHTASNAELLALAERKGAGFSTSDDSLTVEDWSRKSDDIDRRYVREIIADQLDIVDLFEKASKSGDPDVADYAKRMLTNLRLHLVLAHDVRKAVD